MAEPKKETNNPTMAENQKQEPSKENMMGTSKEDKIKSTADGGEKNPTQLSTVGKPGSGVGTVGDVENKEQVDSKDAEGEFDQVRGQIEETLNNFGGRESEIPLNHEYWTLRNRMIALKADKDTQRANRMRAKPERK